MFIVDEETGRITLHRGDTGTITITFTGYDLNNVNAYALFTAKSGGVETKKECQKIQDNEITVSFTNEDTEALAPGAYEYDVRVIIDPEFDEAGFPVTGPCVYTPKDPINLTIRRTVGQV